jgi:MFS family permease
LGYLRPNAHHAAVDGRRRVYLISQPLSAIGSIGAATAQTMPQLLFWRIWQCAGASPGLSVGAAVIGDIYKLEERGTGMGWFHAVSRTPTTRFVMIDVFSTG